MIFDFCEHPQYIDPIRQELRKFPREQWGDFHDEMPLFESFLKESTRLNPADTGELRVCAMYSSAELGDSFHLLTGMN